MTATVHPIESANRTRKALRLADTIERAGGDVAYARGLTDAGWLLVAAVARVGEPSPATRSATIAALQERGLDDDPFEGLS